MRLTHTVLEFCQLGRQRFFPCGGKPVERLSGAEGGADQLSLLKETGSEACVVTESPIMFFTQS